MMVVVSFAKFRRKAVPIIEGGLTIAVLAYIVMKLVQYFSA